MSGSLELLMSRVMLILENRNLRQQMFKFIVTGFCGVFTDVGTYRLLVAAGTHVTPAKALGCLLGTVLVFFINRAWTFSAADKSRAQVIKFACLYGVTVPLNAALNTAVLKLIPQPWIVAFVFAAAVTTVINFFGSKFIVFAPRRAEFIAEDGSDPDFSGSSPDTVAAP